MKEAIVSKVRNYGLTYETLFNFQGPALEEIWGYSSAGRAPALQAGGQRFDPAYLHHSPLGETKRLKIEPQTDMGL